MTLDPLYRPIKKDVPWQRTSEQQSAFETVKQLLSSDSVLTHFDPSKLLGMAIEASEVGIGAILFHRLADGSERPIANVSKILTDCQRRYSQIHKEALAIIFGLKKFHQFLYGRRFTIVTDHKPLLALFGPTKATPAMTANRLARWALILSQYNYKIEFCKTAEHSNADALCRLPVDHDCTFDGEESSEENLMICAVKTVSRQINMHDLNILVREWSKDPVITAVIRNVRDGWVESDNNEEIREFQKLSEALSVSGKCLFYGPRAVVLKTLQDQVLKILHLGHFGIQRMKQLARSAIYWPGIDSAINNLAHQCTTCAENQNLPSKPAVHPWMLSERPWSRFHLDHAINFMGTNWLIMIDALSKYPCIHPTSSISAKSTIDLLEEDFAHFGYPHALVTDNYSSFTSQEFLEWCNSRGIVLLKGAPYHPARNGVADRLVQTFKKAIKKSNLPPRNALQVF